MNTCSNKLLDFVILIIFCEIYLICLCSSTIDFDEIIVDSQRVSETSVPDQKFINEAKEVLDEYLAKANLKLNVNLIGDGSYFVVYNCTEPTYIDKDKRATKLKRKEFRDASFQAGPQIYVENHREQLKCDLPTNIWQRDHPPESDLLLYNPTSDSFKFFYDEKGLQSILNLRVDINHPIETVVGKSNGVISRILKTYHHPRFFQVKREGHLNSMSKINKHHETNNNKSKEIHSNQSKKKEHTSNSNKKLSYDEASSILRYKVRKINNGSKAYVVSNCTHPKYVDKSMKSVLMDRKLLINVKIHHNNQTFPIKCDKNANIWIKDEKWVVIYDPSSNLFKLTFSEKHLDDEFRRKTSLSSYEVNEIITSFLATFHHPKYLLRKQPKA